MKRPLLVIGLVLSLVLALAACSSGPSKPSTTINVTMTDFAFTPNTFTVPAGAQISFTAVNNGTAVHSFTIMKKGQDVSGHYTDADKPNIFWEKIPVNPGETVTDTFAAPADPGTYQIICREPGHFEAGMVAKLIVVASQ